MRILIVTFCMVFTILRFQQVSAQHDEHEHVLPHGHWFVDKIFIEFSNETLHYSLISKQALEEIMDKLHLEYHHDHDDHDDHDHDHDHDHDGHDHDSKHKSLKHDTLNDNTTYSTCYSSDELLEIFGINETYTLINKREFEKMSPALIWMALHEECMHDHGGHEHEKDKYDDPERFLFGSIAIILTWLLSQLSVFGIGKIRKYRVLVILTLQGFAAGNLLGDALFHLVPSALGLHSHGDHDDHGHGHEEETVRDEKDPIWKMCVVVATIFLFWAIEIFMHHHHDHFEEIVEMAENVQSPTPSPTTPQQTDDVEKRSTPATPIKEDFPDQRIRPIDMNVEVKTGANDMNSLKKVKPNGWIAFFGDCLHKAADGLATGAAFSDSLSLGISTALAVFFHEIPHELGDFAVLHTAGFKLYTILILNTIASACSLAAFFIVSVISSDEILREWIFTVVIGVFFYISLINLLPKLRAYFENNEHRKNKKLVYSVLGAFLLGTVLMLLLAIFEEEIKITI